MIYLVKCYIFFIKITVGTCPVGVPVNSALQCGSVSVDEPHFRSISSDHCGISHSRQNIQPVPFVYLLISYIIQCLFSWKTCETTTLICLYFMLLCITHSIQVYTNYRSKISKRMEFQSNRCIFVATLHRLSLLYLSVTCLRKNFKLDKFPASNCSIAFVLPWVR